MEYKGKTALITGASSGIGEEFARVLAGRGMHLALVARSEDKLRALADELVAKHGIRAEVIAADLSVPGAAETVRAATQERGITVDMLVNNAGFGTYGPFATLDPVRDHDEVILNVAAVVDLAHTYLPEMVARGDGAIINIASVVAFQPMPYMAVYGATKAFVLSFSEALWAEHHARGVRVLALCPGPTATQFFGTLGATEPMVGPLTSAERVVADALKALERGKSYVVVGRANYGLAQSSRFFPRSLTARVMQRMLRPRAARTRQSSAAKQA